MSPSLHPAPGRRARTRRLAATTVAAVGLVGILAACGSAGSSGTKEPTSGSTAAAAATCDPVAGDQLVVLTDDKKLQNSDNIIPAVNAKAIASDDAVIPLLDAVSAALTTDDLIAMNKAVDVDRQKSIVVAKQFFDDNGLKAQDTPGTGKKITIGAANFSENQTLAYLYQDVLVSAGYKVTVKTVGNRELYIKQLESGDLTVVPEYAATLTEFLNQAQNGSNATPVATGDIDQTVAALTPLGEKVGLTFGKASAAADQNAFAVTTAFADKYQVKTLSELAQKCGNLVLGGPPECTERAFCQPGLEKTYGLSFSKFVSLDAGGPLTKTAITKGRIAIGLVFSSDGQLAAAGASPTATS